MNFMGTFCHMCGFIDTFQKGLSSTDALSYRFRNKLCLLLEKNCQLQHCLARMLQHSQLVLYFLFLKHFKLSSIFYQ